jgi:spore coat polysaccharide biosynthesis protein SpsF
MTGAFIIARLNSSRLVNKNIFKIQKIPMIVHLAKRLKRSKQVDRVIITTSNEKTDDLLEDVAKEYGLDIYRGSLDSLMDRITSAAEYFDCDNIIEILGDNPIVHSDLIDDVINLYLSSGLDYCANISQDYGDLVENKNLFSVGVRVQMYKSKVAQDYKLYPEYETNGKHPTAFIFDHPEKYKIDYLEAMGKWSFLNHPELNFSVNYPKNFELIKQIFDENYPKDDNFNLESVFLQIKNEPHLLDLFGPEW